ncbi:MAG: TIR domain-containing protein [Candidatus Thorarchaeota archaeon]
MNKKHYPLNVLVIGPHVHSSGSDTVSMVLYLRDHPTVRIFGTVEGVYAGSRLIRSSYVNVVFLGPTFTGSVTEVADFVFDTRKEYPEIVFVLYGYDYWRERLIAYSERFSHYYYVPGSVSHPEKYGIDLNSLDDEQKQHFTESRNLFTTVIGKCQEWVDNFFQYDVAISFAGADRNQARNLANQLTDAGAKVFFDEYEAPDLLGKDLYSHLHEIYSQKAKFFVMLISTNYARNVWTSHERRAAQERALLQQNREYVLPVRLDETPIPELMETTAYIRADEGMRNVAETIQQKLWVTDPDKPKGKIGEWLFRRH